MIAYANCIAYIFKLSKRASVDQSTEHLTVTKLHSFLQSACKPLHSTEIALFRVKNDILVSMDCVDTRKKKKKTIAKTQSYFPVYVLFSPRLHYRGFILKTYQIITSQDEF